MPDARPRLGRSAPAAGLILLGAYSSKIELSNRRTTMLPPLARNDGARCIFTALPIGISNSGHSFAFSRRVSPEFCSALHPLSKERAQGRPGAGWHPRSTVREICTRNAQRHTGEAGNNPAFPAQWLYGVCRALLGDEFVFVTVTSRIDSAAHSVELTTPPLGLTVATTARTTRFCRTQQHRSSRDVKHSRGSAQSSARPALHVSRRRCPRPPQPGPRFVTTYDRPFRGSG
jgi:hypothetical protein